MEDAAQSEKPTQSNTTANANDQSHQPDKKEQDSQQHQKQQGQQQQSDNGGKDQKADGEKKGPAGGYDDTPIPSAPPGWTVKFIFHKAVDLPMADINTLSSDPYVFAELTSALRQRHKEDPNLTLRTPTVRRNCNPVWNTEWIVANVPSSGFKLKARLFDEDPADHDDRLGHVSIHVNQLDQNWEGIREQSYRISKRTGSKRAYLVRGVAACFNKAKHLSGSLFMSIEVLGRTKDEHGGRMYTLGPCWYTKHYSPMLGRLVNRKDSDDDEQAEGRSDSKKAQRYNFQANQMQLVGPVPPQLYHRYVEFSSFVKGMFLHKGLRGWLLSKALHHQHSRIYNYGRSTEWGQYPQGPCKEMTQRFLELVHYDLGGRIFTYVLTLDSLWRFTETGKEFGIDLLSKHTMHSDVSIYIAFSGEFFIRRLKHPNKPPPPEPTEDTSQSHPEGPGVDHNETHPPNDVPGGPPDGEPPKDPAYYELIIDNDSGTYRPNAKMLPVLRQFLADNLPGLHIQVLDCQADEEKMSKWKQEQRDRKKKEGQKVVVTQGSRSGSVSSSDQSDLDDREEGIANENGNNGGGSGKKSSDRKNNASAIKNDLSHRGRSKVQGLKNLDPRQQASRAQVEGKDSVGGIQPVSTWTGDSDL